MKIAFFGTPDIAIKTLEKLNGNQNIQIKLVVTQPDKKVGRKQIIDFPPVKKKALELGLQIFQPENSSEIYEELKKHDIEIYVVFAFGMILKKELIELPKYGALNIHASILPKYRGASPISEAILNGEKETGITIIKIDEKLDHGDILDIFKIDIDENDTTTDLSKKISRLSADHFPKTLEDYVSGKIKLKEQNHETATFCKKHSILDAKLDFNLSSNEIINKIRAFDLNPTAYFISNNGKKILIHKATVSEEKLQISEILIKDRQLLIGTSSFAISVLELTLEGKKKMNIKDFLNGYSKIFE